MTDTGADEAYNASEGILDGSLDYTREPREAREARETWSSAVQKDAIATMLECFAYQDDLRHYLVCPRCYLAHEYDRTHNV